MMRISNLFNNARRRAGIAGASVAIAVFTLGMSSAAWGASAAGGDSVSGRLAKQAAQHGGSMHWFHHLFTLFTAPLWFGSLVLVSLLLERVRALRRSNIMDDAMMKDVQAFIDKGSIQQATDRAQKSNSVLGHAWLLGLQEFSLGGVNLADAMLNATFLEFKPLRKNIQAITTIGVVSPLFGLFGTVMGIIMSFNQMGAAGGANSGKLAAAIGVALFSTAGGIILAIPSIILGRYFAARVVGYADEAEAEIYRLNYRYMHALAKRGESKPAAGTSARASRAAAESEAVSGGMAGMNSAATAAGRSEVATNVA